MVCSVPRSANLALLMPISILKTTEETRLYWGSKQGLNLSESRHWLTNPPMTETLRRPAVPAVRESHCLLWPAFFSFPVSPPPPLGPLGDSWPKNC